MISQTKQKGFTIVELLIVIVIIGILAAISIVAYNSITQRARDTERATKAGNLAKALVNYNADKDGVWLTAANAGTQLADWKDPEIPQDVRDNIQAGVPDADNKNKFQIVPCNTTPTGGGTAAQTGAKVVYFKEAGNTTGEVKVGSGTC